MLSGASAVSVPVAMPYRTSLGRSRLPPGSSCAGDDDMNAIERLRPAFALVSVAALVTAISSCWLADRARAAAGDASTPAIDTSMLPADRATRWQPGMMGAG